MKKIFGFILFISLMTSCIVDYSDVRPVDSYRLQNYVEARRNEVIDVPLALMKTMLEFDAYIRMTDEERPSSSIFFGNYQEVNENVIPFRLMTRRLRRTFRWNYIREEPLCGMTKPYGLYMVSSMKAAIWEMCRRKMMM
jgi:hypothetical protein